MMSCIRKEESKLENSLSLHDEASKKIYYGERQRGVWMPFCGFPLLESQFEDHIIPRPSIPPSIWTSIETEEARALLGRLEFQRGNIEATLRVFDGVDLQAAMQRLQPSLSEKFSPVSSRRSHSHGDSLHIGSHPGANLVLEAIYLKSASLQKLGRAIDAAQECKGLLDSVEKIFQNGATDLAVDIKLLDTISKAVELLPELWKQAGETQEALATYRRVLLNQWNLDDETYARIQKRFAVLLLHGGLEVDPLIFPTQIDGYFIPKNNLEEAILILMILLKKWHLGKIPWDPSIVEHLNFALSICDQTSYLAKQLEELKPGTYHRCDRWNDLALCYSGAKQDMAALNLLRKSLNILEKPNDMVALLLAAKICSKDCLLAAEGVEYAQRALGNAQGVGHLKSVALCLLGICLGKQAKVASSDLERSHLQNEALTSLDEAIVHDRSNPDLVYQLGLQYAEHHSMSAALRCVKDFIDATGGSIPKGWRLLALILSAQQRLREAEVVTDAALDETPKLEQGHLLRIKAKLKVAQSSYVDAIETYRVLLALIQAQRKSYASFRTTSTVEDDKFSEFEVWQDLANLYSRLSHWSDAEICLEKARALMPYSASPLNTEGCIYEALNQPKQAIAAYNNAVQLDIAHASSKVAIGALLWKSGSKSAATARAYLSDALRLEPANRMAWYNLGMLYRDDGRFTDAVDCFQAASMLEESEPVESFDMIT
ncbi:putative UDP-N-acetylglucosamine--peptide N-acetylglucosaminyltransferase SEC [Apostasia shenzhenica]|uniref:Putative UDP-N-acetylglucosamine--peptide N-acetylglucosaminyltransferase SEC n=1 Tax=Apostasia shenzhenica TaxID=1088818 RepID=A0A2I0AGN4_9ASPA|nr:putative UDP-N-acetylglucosamine--peptide N-acetylglucosaminyltransferase SEC [Apostasia shenzhenica]